MELNSREIILERLLKEPVRSLDLFLAIQEAGYGASRAKVARKYRELNKRDSRFGDFERRKHNLSSLLHKLKKQGLVEKKKNKWLITKGGREKYKAITERAPFRRKYRREPDSTFKLVIFDIPEKEKYKRQWLRDKLKELGFQMVQKSVWAGKVKLPNEFIKDLETLNLLGYVEILGITKTGSLRSIS